MLVFPFQNGKAQRSPLGKNVHFGGLFSNRLMIKAYSFLKVLVQHLLKI